MDTKENSAENVLEKFSSYILASASPRRIAMMRQHGIEPLVCPAEIEEALPPRHDMYETVMFLALKKAKWVESEYLQQACHRQEGGSHQTRDAKLVVCADAPEHAVPTAAQISQTPAPVILAADTIVYADEIMGKPSDAADGFRMLSKLRGGMHYVATGVALVEAGRQNARVFTEVTRVYFKNYTDEELRAYLATEEPYDKAGGYAIQGTFAKYIDHIEGDYDNVVGFPWKRIQKELSLLAAFSPCTDAQESATEPESATCSKPDVKHAPALHEFPPITLIRRTPPA